MSGETNTAKLIKGLNPLLNEGKYIFSTLKDFSKIDRKHTLFEFKEKEGTTVVLEQHKADELNLDYEYVAAWITLTIHSSLSAVGLTAIFSTELAKNDISCNVVSGFYHDHIFVNINDATKAIRVLTLLSESYQ